MVLLRRNREYGRYNPGDWRWQNYRQKGVTRSVQCPLAKNGTIGHQKTVENILIKFQLFCVRGVVVPGIGHFCDTQPGRTEGFGRKRTEEWRWPLQENGQSITFAREGCRRDLNGASGQTALWFDKSDFCPVFVPSFSGQTERSAVRNWYTSYSLPSLFFPGRNQKDTKKATSIREKLPWLRRLATRPRRTSNIQLFPEIHKNMTSIYLFLRLKSVHLKLSGANENWLPIAIFQNT